MRKYWNSLNVGIKLNIPIQVILVLILSFAHFWIIDHIRGEILDGAERRAVVSADGVINGMNMLMVTASISNPDNRRLLIKKMSESANVKGLRIIRAKQVQDQFGLGLPEEQAGDDMDRRAMTSKQVQFLLNEDRSNPTLRTVVPFIASSNFRGTNCLACHHVAEGSVNGAASITIDMSEDFEAIRRTKLFLITGQVVLQILLFITISNLICRFMRPIKKLQSTMRTIQLNNFLPFDQEKDIQDVPTLSDVGCSDYDGLNGRDEISELASTFNHMTKRLKEAQKQLVQDKSRLHDTIENAMDAVVQMNTAGFITGWTKHAEIIFGWSREEALGRALHETIIPQQYREGHVQGLQRYLHSGKGTILNSRIEVIGLHRDGSEFPIELSITTITSGDRHEFSAFIRDISERKLAEEEVQRLAFYDPLTLLPNRRLLMDRLQHALANSARSGNSGALLFIDLDHFKTLNDTLGHDIGDLLLQQVGQRLESCLREGDTVARLGGDEFVVLLEELSQKTLEAAAQVETIGEKMLTALNHPYQLGTYKHHNTPSIGAALFSDHESELDELFKKADIAMYQAKKAGRNTIRFFDPKIQETINARAALEEELREALEKQQFHLYYQIQMDGLNQPLGAEVLIRWIHPERGMVSPVQFIPLAEETGLILPIGLWVLDTACAQIKVWEQHVSTRDLVMAVNVSARQFGQTNFVAQVQTIVQCHGINPTRLKLELTESMLVENIKGIISTMKTLKEMGIQFSLDDFGTGYSSLQYLQKLPLNQLKIDQSFVRDMPVDAGGGAIVQTIIAMAKGLNLDIIAEGVETEEQRQLLHSLGCDHYQGYLFSKPVPIEQFEALLTSQIKNRAADC